MTTGCKLIIDGYAKGTKRRRASVRASGGTRENENRWVGMSPEFSSDSERMEQWASTAKLRRHEVERIEALLANVTEPPSFPRPVCNEAIETTDRLGET
jgi:hypothetical protein